jgi:hypothetical protein
LTKFWAVILVLINLGPGSFCLLACFFFTCSVSRIVYKRKPTADPPPSSVSGLYPTSLPNFPCQFCHVAQLPTINSKV